MNRYSPSSFFSLDDFGHPFLFEELAPVWEILSKLGDYLRSLALGEIKGVIHDGAYLMNPQEISIGKGTIVEPGAFIMGPCAIGENCEIRHGAYIRGNVLIGNGCVIGHATEVKNSLFLNEAKAGHFAYVGDSILGNQVNLGAGTKCANLRFDGKNIVIVDGDIRIATGMRKLGAILGDGVQTGCNSVTNPGTLIGKGGLLAPCATAKGVVIRENGIEKETEFVILSGS